jgi:hypothetical protein
VDYNRRNLVAEKENISVTLVKSEQSGRDTSNKTGKDPNGGLPIQRARNGGGAFKSLRVTLVLSVAAVIVVLVTAIVKHSGSEGNGSRPSTAIDTTELSGSNAAMEISPEHPAQPQRTIHRVSAATRDATKLDPAGLLFDLKRVVDQNPETVSKVLGESPVLWPDERSVSETLRGKYKRGKIEIGYAGEGARFITIFLSRCKSWKAAGANSKRCVESDDFTNYRYQEDIPGLLEALGMPQVQRPSVSNMAILRWDGISGIHQISVIPNGLGGINSIHVISSRLYACLLERPPLECQPS